MMPPDPDIDTASPPVSAQSIDRFLQNQSRELEIRAQELKLQEQSAAQEHQYACEALAVQERVLNTDMEASKKRYFWLLVLIGLCVIVVAGLLGFALWKDKDAIVLEIFKSLLYFGMGGAGGYAVGHQRRSSPSPKPDDPED